MTGISPVIVTVILGLTYFDISNKILHFKFIRKIYIFPSKKMVFIFFYISDYK